MLTIQSRIHIKNFSGGEVFNFMINPTDRNYQRWWPGTHLEYHILRHGPNHIGDVIRMDEWIGEDRIKMDGVVMEAEPGRKIVWQMKKGIRLPVWLTLELADDAVGVALTHTIYVGFKGIGRIFDPLLRVYFSAAFEKAMDEHVRTEFPLLRDVLSSEKAIG